MEKIFKKSLALILSAALCLTALVGCLTVSAAEGDTTKPVYSVNSVEGAAGAEVEVVASFSEISNVCAHHVIFTFPAGLEVKAVKNAAGEDYAAFDNSGDRFDYKLDVAEDGTTKVQFLDFVNWAAENLSTSDMSIHFTVKIAADAAANTEYPVTIAVQAADYAAENLLDVTCTNGKVTVKAATTEPVIGVADVNWNASSLAAYHKFNINSFAYDKDYLIKTAYYTSISAGKDISYKFIVKGNGFCVEWGDTKLLSRTGAATLSNLSIANIAYEMTFQLVISYTDASDVQHIDYSEVYTADSRAKIAAISSDKSAALVSLIDTWKSVDTQGFVSVDKPGEAKTFDMTADVTGEADVNWNSTQDALVAAHYVTVSDFKYSKDYLIRGTYYNSLTSMNVLASGFIVTGQGFNVQWENEGLISRTGAATLSNLSVFNVSGDMTWKLYIKYIDADGKTHIDYSSVDTNYITKLNNGGALSSENAEAIDAFKSFYELWSAQ